MSKLSKVINEDLECIIGRDLPWQDLEGKSILITGANGLIASCIIEVILYLNENKFKEKSSIYALARNKDKAVDKFARHLNNEKLKLIFQDVNDNLEINGNIDYIIHAASQASPKHYGKDPVGTLLPNVIGTYNLLQLAREKAVKCFLFISSGEIYGEVDRSLIPIKENTCGCVNVADVRSCYAESKRMGEVMCISWFYQFNVPIKIARLFHTYGPGMNFSDGRVFADFVSDIVNKKDIVMKSDGQAVRSFCYLADAISGIFTIIFKGVSGESYNIGNDKEVIRIIDLADRLAKLFPEFGLRVIEKETPNEMEYMKSKVTESYPDISKLRALGFEPKYSIDKGFRRTIESYL